MKYVHFTNWEPAKIEDVLQHDLAKAMQEYDNGNKKPLTEYYRERATITLLQDGFFRLGGWHFFLKEYCKNYWVKTKYSGIISVYAPDKTSIRNCLKHDCIKIVEV